MTIVKLISKGPNFNQPYLTGVIISVEEGHRLHTLSIEFIKAQAKLRVLKQMPFKEVFCLVVNFSVFLKCMSKLISARLCAA